MKTATLLALLALPVSLSLSQMHHEMKSATGLDKLKPLLGSWKGTDGKGRPVTLSYHMVSDSKAMMETLGTEESKESMVTMYHPDKGTLMATHYCSIGNQPRMRLDRKKSSDHVFTFVFQDATNLKSTKDSHINGLTITIKDENHILQEWSMIENGKQSRETFTYEREE